MNQKFSNERLLLALKRMPKNQRLDSKLISAMEKLTEGKKLKNDEFSAVYAVLYKPNPYVKYTSPEKWERVTRDLAARNLIT